MTWSEDVCIVSECFFNVTECGVAGGYGKLGCLCGKAGTSVICVMAPPVHLGAWSMAMAVV